MPIRENDDRMGSPLQAWTRALERTASIGREAGGVLPVVLEDVAVRFGSAPALIADERSLTFAELAERSRRYARWARQEGISAGHVVALLMPNCADYLAIWLGLTRIGAEVALLNTNLVGASLKHAIITASPAHLIVAGELGHAVRDIRHALPPDLKYWAHGPGLDEVPNLDGIIQSIPSGPLSAEDHPVPTLRDRALLIYTSGTTGLPKAARISHRRLLQWSLWFAGMMNTGPDDRMYNCLPMYHSVGGVVAIGAVLVSGGSVVIRRRFSLRRFWDEIIERNCTLFQYIGELCRYLAKSPPHPREREHRLRLCCGNGLRSDVWQPFQERFAIPRILEFYAATEANFSLYNCEGRPGAIGRIPPFLAHRLRVALVKVDTATGEPVRTADGLCVLSAADEPGEAVSEIQDERSNPGSRFEGYTDASATDRKILRNVCSAGDAWYRSGDLMRRDRAGYFYFVDRIGATYRWKGENVSTAEVLAAISSCSGIIDAIVYGVAVPGAEGRAGMVTLVVEETFELARLRQHLAERLPDYARPLFVRVATQILTTGTFKPRVQEYADAGFDPAATSDPIFVDDREQGAFVRVDAALYDRIRTGSLRL